MKRKTHISHWPCSQGIYLKAHDLDSPSELFYTRRIQFPFFFLSFFFILYRNYFLILVKTFQDWSQFTCLVIWVSFKVSATRNIVVVSILERLDPLGTRRFGTYLALNTETSEGIYKDFGKIKASRRGDEDFQSNARFWGFTLWIMGLILKYWSLCTGL